MNGLVLMFLKITASVWGVVFLLLSFMRIFMPEKCKAFIKEGKNFAVLIAVLMAITAVWFGFFEDAEFRFVCSKETQTCDCYRTSLFRKEPKITDTYSLEGITGADVNSHFRWRSKHSKETAYTVEFSGPENNFEMPMDFRFRKDAQKQAKLADDFLHTDISEYVYTKTSDPVEGMLMFFLFILNSSGIMACISFLVKMNECKKKPENI